MVTVHISLKDMNNLNKNQCLATYADGCYIQNFTEKLSRYATYQKGRWQTEAESISKNASEEFWGTIFSNTAAIFFCYCYYCEFMAFSLFLSHLQFCEKP